MIFLTVGTQFPFDRLVKAIDEAAEDGKITDEIYAQIGASLYKPRNMQYFESLEKQIFDDYIKKASYIISHAGIGTIAMALDNNKPLLVMPRLRKYDAVVNDHQAEIAKKFEQLGHILVAYSKIELESKIQKLMSFVPRPRVNQADALSNRIARFLKEISFS